MSYAVYARIYNFTRKGFDFVYDVKYFCSLPDAQKWGRQYVRDFNVDVCPKHKLRRVWVEGADGKEFGLYGGNRNG